MKCQYCGKEVAEGSLFCDGCGAKLESAPVANPNAFDYQNGMPPKKSNTGLIVTIIIISIMLIAGIIVGVILLTGGSKNDEKNTDNYDNSNSVINNNNYIDDNTNNTKLSKNIKYSDYVAENGDVIIIVKNNNNVDVALDFEIEYYNASGTVVDSDDNFLKILGAGQESVVRLYGSDRDYDNYKITFEAEKDDYYISHQKEVKVSAIENKDDAEMEVIVTNNAKVDLREIEIGVIFYKNNKPVEYDSDSEYDFASGKSMTFYLDFPYDSNYDDIEYDDYKVFVVEAYEENDNY